MAKTKQEDPKAILTPEGSIYGNGPKSQAQSAEGSTKFVRTCKDNIEQRHIILKKALLPAGTKEFEAKEEKRPTSKVRQW